MVNLRKFRPFFGNQFLIFRHRYENAEDDIRYAAWLCSLTQHTRGCKKVGPNCVPPPMPEMPFNCPLGASELSADKGFWNLLVVTKLMEKILSYGFGRTESYTKTVLSDYSRHLVKTLNLPISLREQVFALDNYRENFLHFRLIPRDVHTSRTQTLFFWFNHLGTNRYSQIQNNHNLLDGAVSKTAGGYYQTFVLERSFVFCTLYMKDLPNASVW